MFRLLMRWFTSDLTYTFALDFDPTIKNAHP
jgi:hypothetical protein